MIIWLNGPYGVGKTTVARGLVDRIPGARCVDPEQIGGFLVPLLDDHPVDDFQEWPSWRRLVVAALTEVSLAVAGPLVVPQTVVVRSFWDELMAGLAAAHVPVRAFTLDVADDEHVRRIEGDAEESGAAAWRHRRRDDFRRARPWLAAETQLLDTTGRSADEVAETIARRVRPSGAALSGR